MTKKDYEKAAGIVREYQKFPGAEQAVCVQEAFIALFRGDNPLFDAIRFREACEPKKNKK